MRRSALALAAQVRTQERSARELVAGSLERITRLDGSLHAFLETMAESALARADAIDARVASGDDPGPLAGVPVALKDNLCTRGVATTCSSRILEGWKPPYDAHVVERLESAGAVVVGKTNMDEFAMGSSTENSCSGPTRNPYDLDRVPGGSSGGSAASVAAGLVPLALGSDTGGSIRQPAALCGVVGLKPTYGLVSRYGLVAFASSLDQIGPLAASVSDAAAVLEAIGGHDPKDTTSLPQPVPDLNEALEEGSSGKRIGVVRELVDTVAPEIGARVREAAQALARGGAVVEEVSIPNLAYGLPAYYLIAPAEASSNLARFDGARYGLRVDGPDAAAMNTATRTEGFGAEVKRRIMLGTYALSAGYYDAYYVRAQQVRALVARGFADAYEKFDALLGATTPTTAFRIGERSSDLLAMYGSDACTVPASLAGHPAMSVPYGTDEGGLPIGVQIMAPPLGEPVIFALGAALERAAPQTPEPPGFEAGDPSS
ncbi:MAG: Asp-tRNA(Asn)/Glu-tRNA(Gln) amidotransferase subunit GatA [Acidimicrobiales bacterium]